MGVTAQARGAKCGIKESIRRKKFSDKVVFFKSFNGDTDGYGIFYFYFVLRPSEDWHTSKKKGTF